MVLSTGINSIDDIFNRSTPTQLQIPPRIPSSNVAFRCLLNPKRSALHTIRGIPNIVATIANAAQMPESRGIAQILHAKISILLREQRKTYNGILLRLLIILSAIVLAKTRISRKKIIFLGTNWVCNGGNGEDERKEEGCWQHCSLSCRCW